MNRTTLPLRRPIHNASDERAWVEVNLVNLLDNAQAIASVTRGARLLPVVKADAYGLGATRVTKALAKLNPWGFAVATVEEGQALRTAGVGSPILVLLPARRDMLADFRRSQLTAVLDDASVMKSWDRPFHLEIDTGMSRTGVRWDDRSTLQNVTSTNLKGAFTHLQAADEDPDSIGIQWQRFEQALSQLRVTPDLIHVANSAGAWQLPKKLDLFRPGIFLYGYQTAPWLPKPDPVVSVKARVISVRKIKKGDAVSYGAQWRAPCDTHIATIGIGYADGVPRAIEGCGEVILQRRRRKIVGRITMDMTMVDVGHDEGDLARVGDVATLIGVDDVHEITLGEFARWSNTIAYEILSRLNSRLPRFYEAAANEFTRIGSHPAPEGGPLCR